MSKSITIHTFVMAFIFLVSLNATSFGVTRAILISDGSTLETVIDSRGPFDRFETWDINDNGAIAFSTSLNSGGNVLYRHDVQGLTKITERTSDFSYSRLQGSMNNDGMGCFYWLHTPQ